MVNLWIYVYNKIKSLVEGIYMASQELNKSFGYGAPFFGTDWRDRIPE